MCAVLCSSPRPRKVQGMRGLWSPNVRRGKGRENRGWSTFRYWRTKPSPTCSIEHSHSRQHFITHPIGFKGIWSTSNLISAQGLRHMLMTRDMGSVEKCGFFPFKGKKNHRFTPFKREKCRFPLAYVCVCGRGVRKGGVLGVPASTGGRFLGSRAVIGKRNLRQCFVWPMLLVSPVPCCCKQGPPKDAPKSSLWASVQLLIFVF